MNVTIKQKEMLINVWQEKSELLRGRVDRKSGSRQKLNTIWDDIAVHLNAIEGPQKNGKEWAKTWKDIKGYILKKEAKRRSYTQGTGGGPPPQIAFSTFEENVLQVLTPEAAGLDNIPEGGISNEIHEINCDIGQINNTRINKNITETENIEIRNEPENETTFEINQLAEEIDGEERDTENISPNYILTPINNARKVAGGRLQEMSRSMLDIQLEKLHLKKKEIQLREETLIVQRKILFELKQISSQLNLTTSDTNI